MSTWHRHRAHRNIRASSIAAPAGEGWTIRNHRAILRSEPYASADLGAASDVTAKSNLSEAAPVSPAPAISPQRHSAVIAPAHGDGISGNIGSGGRHVPGGVAGTIQCVLGRPSQITSRPDLHHLSALFGRREQSLEGTVDVPRQTGEMVVGALEIATDSIGDLKTAVFRECRINCRHCADRARVRTARTPDDRTLLAG